MSDLDKQLIEAIEEGNLYLVKNLIKQGANVESKYKGMTALMYASYCKHIDIVKFLIKNGADVNATDSYNESVLTLASYKGINEIIKILVKSGADIHYKNNFSLIKLASLGHIDGLKTLIDNGADVNAKDYDGWNALIGASEHGYNEVVKTLIENKADVNYKWIKDGSTALMWASRNGHNDVVETLIKHGADVNAKNEDGYTALILASIYEEEEVIKTLLIDYKAEVTEEDIINLKDEDCTFTLDLIAKRDFEKSLQQEIKPIQEKKTKTNTGKL